MYPNSVHSFQSTRNNQKYVKDIFKVLNIYYWIHGVGISNNKGNCLKYLATGLTIFYVANSFVLFIIQCNLLGITESNLKNLSVLFLVFSLGLCQRWLLLLRKRRLYVIVNRLHKILIRNFTLYKRNIKCTVFLLLIIADGYLVGLFVSVVRSLRGAALFQEANITNNATEVLGLSDVIYLNLFFIHWSDIGLLIAIYFVAVCHILQVLFSKIKEKASNSNANFDCIIPIYTEAVDICKETNDIFSPVVLLTFVNLLSSVFYHAFNIFINDADLSRYLTMIFGYVVFVTMCYVASTVTATAIDAKYMLQKSVPERMFQEKQKFAQIFNINFVGFTILDSVIIDRSFILSSTGVLVTYGVMIATFHLTSEEK